MEDPRKKRAPVTSLVVPSLLDRLIGDRFAGAEQTARDRSTELMDVREYKRTVLSDLEYLLNTVCAPLPEGAEDLEQVPVSLASYGVPDLSGFSVSDPEHWGAIEELLKQAIVNHEPRLTGISIERKSVEELTRSLSLQVVAKLHVPPVEEPIVIDARLDLETLTCEIKEKT